MSVRSAVKFTLLLLSTLASLPAVATHNRAGEITYRHLEGNTYEITITTCTKESAIADRPYLHIAWGDESTGEALDSLERTSTTLLTPDLDAQINIYIGNHTYGGPGVYHIVMEDPNRNSGVENIPSSVQQVFCIETVLVINPQAGFNNSVVLLNPAKEQACLNQFWIHNPAAFDPDGDELHYSLVECMGNGCNPLPGYEYPDVNTDDPTDVFQIDPVTGDLTWDVPPTPGEFNAAILIEEFRNGIFVGSVIRDMQITVRICDNEPPVIIPIADLCVDAGDVVVIHVDASDPDGDDITYSAHGGPLTQVVNEATFNANTATFTWHPECEEVRAQPYLVTFEATDDNFTTELTDIESVFITVVGPAVENPFADAQGNSILLTWDANPCAPIMSKYDSTFTSYKIYRRVNLFGFVPGPCEVGVPGYTGYSYIGTVQGVDNTSYEDDAIYYGGNYCYMIVTCWPDGAQGYASEEVCAEIIKELPIMTKVSITATDAVAGADSVCWSQPYDLDTLNFLPPYQYKLFWIAGTGQPATLIYDSPVFNSLSEFTDTCFIHSGINTSNGPHTYRIEMWSSGERIGTSSSASSVFASAVPNDQSITLNLSFQVPWTNYSCQVYRFDNGIGDFLWIGESATPTYTDTGLENNTEYCYVVNVLGTYSADEYLDSLFNASQEICSTPYDHNPPCAPELAMDPDCEAQTDLLQWSNPNNSCADDVTGYNLYYTPVLGGPMELLATYDLAEDTIFLFNAEGLLNTIAGCFVVTALDGPNTWPDGLEHRNESEPSEMVCADNCPLYWLPNIYTPNGDLANDTYRPIFYRFIESIDFKVYNRWGVLVFETSDPAIQWSGINRDSGNMSSDGVYYYTIVVNTIRLSGIVPERFSGEFHLVDGKALPNPQ